MPIADANRDFLTIRCILTGVFRNAGAVVMALAGVVLLLPSMQTRIAVAAGPAGNWVDHVSLVFRPKAFPGNLLSGCFLASYGRRALARPSERRQYWRQEARTLVRSLRLWPSSVSAAPFR
jgi:hypothetical protein